MIDFKNGSFVKLRKTDNSIADGISKLLIPGEETIGCYKGIRDNVIFTNKRIISVNIQGMTGMKKDFTLMPYSKIQLFSVETAGAFDFDSALEVYFNGVGQIRFEFTGACDIERIGQLIASYTL
ncbi:MAG: PH domain-containing protein [Lacrimispora sp.]